MNKNLVQTKAVRFILIAAMMLIQLSQQANPLYAQEETPLPDVAPLQVEYNNHVFIPMMTAANNEQNEIIDLSLAITSYTIDVNLTQLPSITGRQLDDAIRTIRSDSGLIGLGNDAVAIGQQLGINPVYIMAHAAWESAWGTSAIARDKNNLFGYGAYDSCPYSCAHSYSSKAESVRVVMNAVKTNYLTAGGIYYHGQTLRGMNVRYATDPNWGNGIKNVMNSIAQRIGSSAYPGGSTTPPPSSPGGCYGGAQSVTKYISSYTYQFLGQFTTTNRCSDINIKVNHSAYVYIIYYSSSRNRWVHKSWQYVPANTWKTPITGISDGTAFQVYLWNATTSSRSSPSQIAY